MNIVCTISIYDRLIAKTEIYAQQNVDSNVEVFVPSATPTSSNTPTLTLTPTSTITPSPTLSPTVTQTPSASPTNANQEEDEEEDESTDPTNTPTNSPTPISRQDNVNLALPSFISSIYEDHYYSQPLSNNEYYNSMLILKPNQADASESYTISFDNTQDIDNLDKLDDSSINNDTFSIAVNSSVKATPTATNNNQGMRSDDLPMIQEATSSKIQNFILDNLVIVIIALMLLVFILMLLVFAIINREDFFLLAFFKKH